jgi:hypothetical protein
MTALQLPYLLPPEVAFVGQVVSIVTRRGGHISEVKRLGDGGVRVYAVANEVSKWLDFRIADSATDGWAMSWRGNPITAKDFAWQLCKLLDLRSVPGPVGVEH